MLLEFSCANHKSINSQVLFSCLAGADKYKDEITYPFEGHFILPSAVIYGSNGSGKSNFVDSIRFVKSLVMNSVNYQIGQGISQVPHKTAGFSKDSTYRIQFVTNNIRYSYGFSITNMLIVDEYLYYFPNGKQTKIFEREGISFTTGRSFRNKLSRCKDVLKSNRLLLSCAANFSSVPEIEKAYLFFVNELVIFSNDLFDDWMFYSVNQLDKNIQIKNSVIKLLQNLGVSIKNINIHIDEKKVDITDIPPFLSDEFKNKLLQGSFNAVSAEMVYEHFSTDLFAEESAGIKRLVGFLCPFLDIILNGKVLICDELESSLHEALVYQLLKLFFNNNTESGIFPQLIFTTHDTSLLNLDLFRRDQIWFTEMRGEDRSTDLYSLAEIKSVRKDENYEKGYISGKYGAIPMLNHSFFELISKE